MMNYSVYPPEEIIEDAVVAMPLSKSVANRALVLAALSGQPVPPVADAEGVCSDVAAVTRALAVTSGVVDIADAGTAMRFLTAYYAAVAGSDVTLTGTDRMKQRPVRPLVDALRACGADIEYAGEEGFPPLRIKGRELKGGTVTVDATLSSQFVSALLMVAPLMTEGLTIVMEEEPVSVPYIKMTLAMMRRRGIESVAEPLRISVPHGSYRPEAIEMEGDWSAAAFWYEITALSAGWFTLSGLSEDSLQGDARCRDYFERLGVVTVPSEATPGALDLQPSPEVYGRVDLDLSDTPDMAPALVVCCCMLGVPFRFVGLQGLGIKECDRLAALCAEMEKVGCIIERIRDFGLEWDGKRMPILTMPVFETYSDHRMAMALAPVAFFIPGIVVKGAECVRKSYPEYWDHLLSIGFTLKDPETATPEEE